MNRSRRWLLSSLVVATTLLLAACGSVALRVDAEAQRALAPSGTLRVGVYPGSPTSMIVEAKTGQKIGIAHDLGRELATQLGVPFVVVEFRRVAEVLDALRIGAVDFTFANATAVRAKDVDFTVALLQLELGCIVPSGSKIAAVPEIDQPGVRVGVSEGSSSQGTLSKQFKNATIIPAPSLKVAREMLSQGKLDAFATNKAVLSELTDELPGSRLLDGRWGLENMAIAVPKGRERGATALREFAERAKTSGLLRSIVTRTGLRGSVNAE